MQAARRTVMWIRSMVCVVD
ncbi:hypothetical protein EYF80_057374 [Liparis tanakae]|uniref:Uncharacterized protein n=1 Tax=Liparis tanakae TaxID=230148 RepID=A0A4Z2EVS5_9TELE|nr:hypothetical protein EYF80_057374 [Liparis tanakae]